MRMETPTLPVIVAEALDNAWDPLLRRCEGMADAEYLWQPVAGSWTVHAHDGGWRVDWADPDPTPAPVTTIAWRCWHLAVDCLDSYSARLFGRSGTGLTGTEWVGDWAAARSLLAESWSVFRAGVVGWDDDALMQRLGPAWGPFANHAHLDLVHHAVREIVHHGAEIALLRDLYAQGA